ncbi:hypothetical protein ABK040_001519 [Willaertia magna]
MKEKSLPLNSNLNLTNNPISTLQKSNNNDNQLQGDEIELEKEEMNSEKIINIEEIIQNAQETKDQSYILLPHKKKYSLKHKRTLFEYTNKQ